MFILIDLLYIFQIEQYIWNFDFFKNFNDLIAYKQISTLFDQIDLRWKYVGL